MALELDKETWLALELFGLGERDKRSICPDLLSVEYSCTNRMFECEKRMDPTCVVKDDQEGLLWYVTLMTPIHCVKSGI